MTTRSSIVCLEGRFGPENTSLDVLRSSAVGEVIDPYGGAFETGPPMRGTWELVVVPSVVQVPHLRSLPRLSDTDGSRTTGRRETRWRGLVALCSVSGRVGPPATCRGLAGIPTWEGGKHMADSL